MTAHAQEDPRPTSSDLSPAAGTRCGMSVADLKQSFLDNLFCALGRVPPSRRATTFTPRWR